MFYNEKMKLITFTFLLTIAIVNGLQLQKIPIVHEVEASTLPPPPKPYAFGYAAGRFPGHIDRTHSEVSDGSGTVQGSYSYVDPRQKIYTVNYIADKTGFHPIVNGNDEHTQILPQDTDAVARAKHRHLVQFANIANRHNSADGPFVLVPVDSAAVQNAKNRHLSLYQQIAEEHAKIAAERGGGGGGHNDENSLVEEH